MSRTDDLIKRFEAVGFEGGFVRDCLPDWWDRQYEESESSWLQLQLGLAQRLSIEPSSMFDDAQPLRINVPGNPKYKHLKLTEAQQRAVYGFGAGVARLVTSAMRDGARAEELSPVELRTSLLKGLGAPWIGLPEVLTLCASLGIPVGHLTVFPAGVKGMAAMTLRAGGRGVIFCARKPIHPAQAAFFIAHELGHLALGHVSDGAAIVEAITMDPEEQIEGEELDPDEQAADQFAFQLLTGMPSLTVQGPGDKGNAMELLRGCEAAGREMAVDPGLLMLCYGRATKRWPTAGAALKRHQAEGISVASEINRGLRSQLDPGLLSYGDLGYLDATLAV